MKSRQNSRNVAENTVHNHDWKNPDCLNMSVTPNRVCRSGTKLVSNADLVIGTGSIMPIEVCGFTAVENTCPRCMRPDYLTKCTGQESMSPRNTSSKAENPVRASADSLARKGG
jgi:hypothetical protein